MTDKSKQDIGLRLKSVREDLGLNQEQWAKMLQVTTNTLARWEQLHFEPTGPYRRRVEQVFAIAEDEKAKAHLKEALESGKPAAAALMGMFFGVLTYLGSEHGLVTPLFKGKPSLFEAILNYRKDILSWMDETTNK